MGIYDVVKKDNVILTHNHIGHHQVNKQHPNNYWRTCNWVINDILDTYTIQY
jgi:hypothetical protein